MSDPPTPESKQAKNERLKAERAAKAAEQNRKNAEALAAMPPFQRRVMYVLTALLFVFIGYMLLLTFGVFDGKRAAPTPIASTAGMTPSQLLAVGADRDKDDPEIAAAYARLDAACPEDGELVADIATNFKRIVREKTGQDYPIIFLMGQLSEVQEAAPQQKCAETAAMLAIVASEW